MVMVMVQTALTSTSVHSYIELEGVILQGTVTVVKEVSPPLCYDICCGGSYILCLLCSCVCEDSNKRFFVRVRQSAVTANMYEE